MFIEVLVVLLIGVIALAVYHRRAPHKVDAVLDPRATCALIARLVSNHGQNMRYTDKDGVEWTLEVKESPMLSQNVGLEMRYLFSIKPEYTWTELSNILQRDRIRFIVACHARGREIAYSVMMSPHAGFTSVQIVGDNLGYLFRPSSSIISLEKLVPEFDPSTTDLYAEVKNN